MPYRPYFSPADIGDETQDIIASQTIAYFRGHFLKRENLLAPIQRQRSACATCHAHPSFAGGRPLCTQILPGRGRLPATILDVRKLETLGLRW